MQLNAAQQQAVSHRSGPLLVLAGAGTGKTRVITERIANLLLEGVPAWRILAVTFTNKAAGEMRSRIALRCRETPELSAVPVSELWVGTFHAIAARILRRNATEVGLTSNFAVYDAGDQKTLMTRVLKDMALSEKVATPQTILWHIDQAKNGGLGREQLSKLALEPQVHRVVDKAWQEYERRLRAADAVDFGDLIVLSTRLLEREPDPQSQLADFDPVARLRTRFTHVVVDEFQDTNPIQARMIERLAQHATLCVVGDDDQAIYGWRGADVNIFLDFDRTHPGCETIRLEQNYRSTQNVLDCADAVISRNSGRLGKTLFSERGAGELVRVIRVLDEREEAMFIARELATAISDGEDPEECAIFYRTHAQSRALEEALRKVGLGYRMVGGTRFFDRLEVKDILAYLRLILVPTSDLDCQRVINRPTRGIGDTSVERLAQYAASKGISLLQACDHTESAGLGTAAKRKVDAFADLMRELVTETAGKPLHEVAEIVVEKTGYREHLAKLDDIESESRLENVQELLGALEEWGNENPEGGLALYLEQTALASDADDAPRSKLTLMTVHSAKGLEFERVYMTGMEERVFPHARAYEDPAQMEEERRLAYVAITRAKRHLCLSYAASRFLWGQQNVGHPSRFARELPATSAIVAGSRPTARPSRELPRSGDVLSQSKPRAASWDDDIVRDADVPQSDAEGITLYVGQTVGHSKYGRGEVLGWSGHGAECKLSIRFRGHGVKTIVARFVTFE